MAFGQQSNQDLFDHFILANDGLRYFAFQVGYYGANGIRQALDLHSLDLLIGPVDVTAQRPVEQSQRIIS